MTVASYNDRKSGPIAGDGTKVQFAFDFYIEKKEWADVISRNTTTGVETTKQEGVDYTFNVGSLKNALGGNITFTTAPQSDEEIMINGEAGDLQEYNASAGNSVNSTDIENAFDRIVRSVQELRRNVDLSGVRLSTFPGSASLTLLEFLAADVGKFLKISDEDPPTLVPGAFVTTALSSTSFGESLLAAANATAANALLFNSFIQTLVDDTTATLARRTLAVDEIVMLDPTIEVATESLGTSNVAFTAVDITPHTPGGDLARFAILRVQNEVTQTAAIASRSATVGLRKTGTTPAKYQQVRSSFGSTLENDRTTVERGLIVALDSNERFDYEVILASGVASFCEIRIDLEGYIL